MIDWSKSYTSLWRIFKVNADTWQDGDLVGKADGLSITRTADGALIESGSLQTSSSIEDGWYRVVMLADQNGAAERVELCTMLFEASGGTYGDQRYEALGRSVLYPASTKRLLSGSYILAGADGAAYAGRLLAGSTPAPVVVEGSFALNDTMVHELDSTVLEAVWAVLNAGGFCIQIDGRGVIHVRPQPTDAALELSNLNARLLMPIVEYSDSRVEVPNRLTAINGARSATVENNDPSSPVSTVRRGYTVDVVEQDAMPVNGETIDAYAARRLRQLSTYSDERTYTREYWPGVLPYDIVKGSIPSVGLDGDMRVVSQSLRCGAGITVTERAVKEVPLW